MKDAPELESTGNSTFSEKYANVLWYVALALTAILYVAATVVVVRCYIPYAFLGFVAPSSRLYAFGFVGVCAALVTFIFWLSNVLVKRVRPHAVIGVFALCCVLVAAPFLLKHYDERTVSYAVSAYFFFAAPVSISFFAGSLLGRREVRAAGTVLFAVGFIATSVFAGVLIYYSLNFSVLSPAAPSLLLPAVSLCALIVSFARLFGAVRTFAVIRQYVLLGAFAVISGFRIAGQPANVILAILTLICTLALAYDYVAYTFLKKYDSEDMKK